MSFNFNKFTLKSQEAIAEAQAIAQNYSNQQIEPVHLFAALLQSSDGIVLPVLQKLGANVNYLKIKVHQELEQLPKVTGASIGNQYLSQNLARVFDNALKEAISLKDEYISTEHLLIALASDQSNIGRLLNDQGVTKENILKVLKDIRGTHTVRSQNPEETYQALQKYGRNLNELAKLNKLDPVIGREDEIRRVLQVLSRRTKNNPVLIGEPGVGKTAIVEGLAHRIVQGDVPENLKTKQVVALDMGALVAGTQFRGQFEERMKAVLKEVQESNGEIILFIDELHTVVGAGSAQGAVDAANILKPALARGELHCIGATTIDEYRKHIEKDPALERRFQPILVNEPSVEDTISILRGLKERYEVHHGVQITDSAIVAATQLSYRYITDRFLPDKAIDLIDEAASKLRIEIDSMPEELDSLDRKIKQLEIEREALKREIDQIGSEKDSATKERLESIEKEIFTAKEEFSSLKIHWQKEKDLIKAIRQMKEEIEHLKHLAESYERVGDYAKVAEIRYGRIIEIQKELERKTYELSELQKYKKMLKEQVDAEDVAEIVAKWTGIPVQRMLETEKTKLLNLEERLHQRVVGQDDAVRAVANAIRRSRAGLQDQKKPIGSFIFIGTTGVGKTELARALAEYLFNDERALIRIDMSEYMEKFSVSRLIGAPPGYVGHEEGGQLTEAVRRKPYSVVLLDEIEKAHPEVFNILLQVLDEGRLTDSKGVTVNFRNTIIIMTSNIGSHLIQDKLTYVNENNIDSIMGELRIQLTNLLRQTIRPEFLNRIDEIILFKPLTKSEIQKIVELQLSNVCKMLSEKNITLEITEDAKSWLAELGYDATYGARPLQRAIQRYVLNPLSEEIIKGKIDTGDTVRIELDSNGKLIFSPYKVEQVSS